MIRDGSLRWPIRSCAVEGRSILGRRGRPEAATWCNGEWRDIGVAEPHLVLAVVQDPVVHYYLLDVGHGVRGGVGVAAELGCRGDGHDGIAAVEPGPAGRR